MKPRMGEACKLSTYAHISVRGVIRVRFGRSAVSKQPDTIRMVSTGSTARIRTHNRTPLLPGRNPGPPDRRGRTGRRGAPEPAVLLARRSMLRARVRMDIGTRPGLKLGCHSVLVQATVGQATVGLEENSSALFTRNPAQTLRVRTGTLYVYAYTL